MTETYIAGYDGSTASVAAVRMAVRLAAARGDRVVAVHAFPLLRSAGLRGAGNEPEPDAQRRDEATAKLAELEVDGVARRVVIPGSPAKVLHDAAVEEDASLIAVGATHHRGIGRVTPGSVAANLLHGAPCPVLVVPADRDDAPIDAVVVAYDESEQSEAALHRAVGIAREAGARLRIVSALEPRVTAGPGMIAGDLDAPLREEVRTRLQEIARTTGGLEVEPIVRTGSPADVLAEAVGPADLIVTGSRGYGPLHSVILGGVSRQLVDRAPCAVLVVPRVAAPPDGSAERHRRGGDQQTVARS